MDGWKRSLRIVALIALVVVLYFTVPVNNDLGRSPALLVVVDVVAVALLTAGVIWQVRLQLDGTAPRVDGLVLALVVSVLSFALTFYILEDRDPGQIAELHTRLDSLYFTMSTLLTVGYGDVHAVGQTARGLVVVQMLFNVLVIATAATTLSSRIRARVAVRAESRRAAADDESARPRRRHGRRTHRNPT